MKSFLSFVAKEFRHIFRDRWTMLILLAMPVVQIILFGFAISTEVRHVRVAAVQCGQDAACEKLLHRIDQSEYFDVVRSYAHVPGDISRLFADGEVDLVLTFEQDFSRHLYAPGGAVLQAAVDASDASTAQMYVSYLSPIVAQFGSELAVEAGSAGGIRILSHMLYNPEMKSSYLFVPGIMGIIILLICAMMTSISIVREKENGTMELLLTAPLPPGIIILSKMVPYFILSVVNLSSILLLSRYVLDVPLEGSLMNILLLSFLYLFVCLLIGLLISSIARTQVAAMLMSGMVLLVPSVMLTGIIFPVENMPEFFQWLSCVMPPRWYVGAVRKLMIEGLPLSFVGREILILLCMGALLIVANLKKFKTRLE